MRTIDASNSVLLLVDLQARLMPAIDGAETVIANASKLQDAAKLLDIPAVITEQNPRGIGGTVAELLAGGAPVETKMTFDACRAPGFADRLPAGAVVVAGCESHVCVLQTTLGLLDRGRQVFLVADAVGSRLPSSKAAAIERMRHHGAEVVTTEMVLFEWLATCEHPKFREVLAVVKGA